MRVSFIDAMGARTRYYHAGSGPAVILVHGVGMCSDSWLLNIPALAETCAVYAPDLLDNGMTGCGPYRGGPPQPYMADHLVAFIDALGLDRVTLVGSSLGCAISILVGLKMPDRIESLVLVGPGTTMNPPDLEGDPFKASYVNGRAAILNPTFEACKARIGNIVYDASAVPDILPAMQMTLYALPGALESFERRLGGLRDVEGLRRFHVHSRMPDLRWPTLVVVGRDDKRGNVAETIEAASRIPDVETILYERCGHWPHIEHPKTFNQDLKNFLKPIVQAANPAAEGV